jgi:hypothetical protein
MRPPLHRPAGDIELADVRLVQRLVAFIPAASDEERVLSHTDEQIPVEQETDAAEHLPLLDVLVPGQSLSDAFGKGFVKGHR